jgi:hypothetical protein
MKKQRIPALLLLLIISLYLIPVIKGNPLSGSNNNRVLNAGDTGTATPFAVKRVLSILSSGKEMRVDLKIHKESITGKASIEETLPAGFAVKGLKNPSGDYKFKKNKITFTWKKLPAKKDILISYRLTPNKGATGTQVITGTYTYQYSGSSATSDIGDGIFYVNKRKYSLPETTQPDVAPAPVASANTIEVHPVTSSVHPTAPIISEATPAQVKNKESAKPTSDVTTPVNEANITYKIQVLSLRHPAPANVFGGKYKITDITSETAKGRTKYFAGNYTDFSLAEKRKAEIDKMGLTNSFIVAYRDGKRITINEARNNPFGASDETGTTPAQNNPRVENNTNYVSKIPLTVDEGAIAFKVQVLSVDKPVSNLVFSGKFKITDITSETSGGRTMYFTGNYDDFSLAEKRKAEMDRIGLWNSFIVAFKGDKRITIHEAREETNKKSISYNNEQ